MPNPSLCRCGSGVVYLQCCAPFHTGDKLAPTAEALMRSRFSAYCLHNAAYLLATWDARTRPMTLSFAGDQPCWQSLDIVRTQQGRTKDSKGKVEFNAFYTEGGQRWCLNERSRFVKAGGRWFYVDGVVSCFLK